MASLSYQQGDGTKSLIETIYDCIEVLPTPSPKNLNHPPPIEQTKEEVLSSVEHQCKNIYRFYQQENASNLPASIPSSSSSTQPHKRHAVSAASIESLRNRMCGRTSTTNQISELDIFVLQGSVPYQEVINEDGHEDLLKYWRGNEKTFPTLSLMARDVLNIQASSTAYESAFSRARYQIGDHGHSLAGDTWKLRIIRRLDTSGAEKSCMAKCCKSIKCSHPSHLHATIQHLSSSVGVPWSEDQALHRTLGCLHTSPLIKKFYALT
ncbi:hypothetical protein RND71_002034 [Anisodus tanguticus]|uniref:HAT C-terminal dimerisation domain-containing protein n=1 Tax=Anisodus tanguticus TaxID=243964 RepID=A0AAE1T1X1_9SOLA|nr:hypothetical protein RND71_002034 [Anisodus tanguticus]